MAKRYEQLRDIIAKYKPSSIVEVGVHRAMRGMLMCEWAFGHKSDVSYLGFDVFDTVPDSFHEEALNGKGVPSEAMAAARLQSVQERWPEFKWKFIVGDTRQTLHGSRVKCDLAFIDGDHRVDAIRGDAFALDCPVMVFDDYYTMGDSIPDLSVYGANVVVDELVAQGASVKILPLKDKCAHGGFSNLALVKR